MTRGEIAALVVAGVVLGLFASSGLFLLFAFFGER